MQPADALRAGRVQPHACVLGLQSALSRDKEGRSAKLDSLEPKWLEPKWLMMMMVMVMMMMMVMMRMMMMMMMMIFSFLSFRFEIVDKRSKLGTGKTSAGRVRHQGRHGPA